MNVEAATVTLSAVGAAPRPAALAKPTSPVTLGVTVTDTGNIDAVGSFAAVYTLFNADHPLGTLPPVSSTQAAHIKVGKGHKFTTHAPVSSAVPAGVYSVQVVVSLAGVTTTAVLPGTLTVH